MYLGVFCLVIGIILMCTTKQMSERGATRGTDYYTRIVLCIATFETNLLGLAGGLTFKYLPMFTKISTISIVMVVVIIGLIILGIRVMFVLNDWYFKPHQFFNISDTNRFYHSMTGYTFAWLAVYYFF